MRLDLEPDSLPVYKALASETRLEILKLLAQSSLTASEIGQQISISKSILSRHIKILEDAHLIQRINSQPGSDGRKKTYALRVEQADIVFPRKIYFPFKKITAEIKLGYFSDFSVTPSCGLASKEQVIGAMDDPRVFVSNERTTASLLWLSDGYVEYRIPNLLEPHQIPELLEFSLELASEFPSSNNIWPSDITFTLNGVPLGTWTCPGNFSDVKGKLNPDWWNPGSSQYGLLKSIYIYKDSTGLDGDTLSNAKLSDLHLGDSPFITLRIGIERDAVHKGGLTIFGEHFGNHPQNIIMNMYYSEQTGDT